MSIEELVASVVPMVWSCARELKRPLQTADLEELVADGYLGAVKAANAFQPERGLQFVTYARHRIRGEMIDGLRRRDYISRGTRHASTEAWQEAEAAGRDYLDERLAPPLSMEMPMSSGDGDYVALGTLLADAGKPFTDTFDDVDLVRWALPLLRGRQAELVRRMYWEDEGYNDIAASWQVSVSRVSQLHSAALHVMRLALIRSGIDSVEMVKRVAAVAKRRPAHNVDSVERGALFGDLIKFWAAA